MNRLFVILLLLGWLSSSAFAAAGRETQANMMVGLHFTAMTKHDDPFNRVVLDVIFTAPDGSEKRVPAFWAGGDSWKVRYASPQVGSHTFRSDCNVEDDPGLHGITGSIEIKPYSGDNPIYRDGPLRVSADKHHLETADGKPFFWLGDTWWMGLSKRLAWPEDVKRLAQDRKQKGFNVIQIVVGPYPDSHPFDPRSVNEGGFPWEKDYTAINPAYFDNADERIFYLVEQGFRPSIFGMWGYHMSFMGVERARQHWRYLIARYGALPVVWSIAGEANLPWYLAPGFPYHDGKQVTQWTEVAKYVHEIDPFDRLVTIHPTGIGGTARDAIDDDALLDFDMLQTPHGGREAVGPTIDIVRRSQAGDPKMPTINGEAAYERLLDSIETMWTRRMFWVCMTNGAAGHTYGANGIWQVNRPGDPHGPSPHHPAGSTGYGTIPWKEAMHLGGSTQVGLGKAFFEQFEWHKFRPQPNGAEYAAEETLALDEAKWIWLLEGEPARNAPAQKRYFRKTFEIPPGKKIYSAQLRASADDRFVASINDHVVGSSDAAAEAWRSGKQFDVASSLKEGVNTLSIEAENLPAPAANPAGLIAHLRIDFVEGDSLSVVTDDTWQVSKSANATDDSWSAAFLLGDYGMLPWGPIEPVNRSGSLGPQSTGIAGAVRVIYVPDAEPVQINALDRNKQYAASWFNPVTGDTKVLDELRPTDTGTAIVPPPEHHDHDWVLVVQAKEQ